MALTVDRGFGHTLSTGRMGLRNQEGSGRACTGIEGSAEDDFPSRSSSLYHVERETRDGSTWSDRSDGRFVDEDDPCFETPDDPRIPPGKERFKIGEVARIVGVKPYVLRYWEGEFPWVSPVKTDSGQRRYGREDVAALLKVRRLRHDEKLSIARTRLVVEQSHRTGRAVTLPGSVLGDAPENPRAGVDREFVRRHLAEIRRAAEQLLRAVEE